MPGIFTISRASCFKGIPRVLQQPAAIYIPEHLWLFSVAEIEDVEAAFVFLTCCLSSEELQDKTQVLNCKWPVHQTTMTFLMRRDISVRFSSPGKASVQFLLLNERHPSSSVLTSWNEDTGMEQQKPPALKDWIHFYFLVSTCIITLPSWLHEGRKQNKILFCISDCISLGMGTASVKAEHDCFN